MMLMIEKIAGIRRLPLQQVSRAMKKGRRVLDIALLYKRVGPVKAARIEAGPKRKMLEALTRA